MTDAAMGMTPPKAGARLREVVAVFDDADCLDGAVTELQQSGFNRMDLSVAGDLKSYEDRLGHPLEDVGEIEDSPEAPRAVHVSKASIGDAEGVLVGAAVYIGAVLAAAIAAAAGASLAWIVVAVAVVGALAGLAGGWMAWRLDRRYRQAWMEQARHGGLVLWVNLHSGDEERRALDVLAKCRAKRIHVHEVAA